MGRLSIAIVFAASVGLGSAATADDDKAQLRADAMERSRQSCPLAVSAPGCPSLRMGPRAGVRFDRSERAEQTRALYARIEASLAAGDCEGARSKALDDGRHELAARIRRACKAAS